MKEYTLYLYTLLLACIVSAMVLTSCDGEELAVGQEAQTSEVPADVRQLVQHEVTVSLDGASTRVGYTASGDGLQLSWDASEKLGVYIRQTGGSILYAGQMTGSGVAHDRGPRTFAGSISQKSDGEEYLYIYPAPTGEVRGQSAQGKISLTGQSGVLDSCSHLKNYIPLVWHESSRIATIQGYAVHLQLTFKENPGMISKITLRTMDKAGVTEIFPVSYDVATLSAGQTKAAELTLNVSGTARKSGNQWTADAYLACCFCDADVFRTKYEVMVTTESGLYYNEFQSFPGQQATTPQEGLPMLANGKCYNLTALLTRDVATTVINTQYQVNSLLGMWDAYGNATDPFGLIRTSGLPEQLQTHILDRQSAFTERTLIGKSSQGTPTFTWSMVTSQSSMSASGVKQSDVSYNNIEIVSAPTEVYLTFISEYAWSQNLLGYYHYETGSVPSHPSEVLKTIIFPNVSKGGHVPYNRDGSVNIANVNPNTAAANVAEASKAPLAEYTTVQLLYNAPDGSVSKQFPVGTTIGFFIMRDPKASSSGTDAGTMGDSPEDTHSGYQPREDNSLIDWTAWRLFTNTAWNGATNPYTGSYNNTGWWNMNCWNFFCSADVCADADGTPIPGLALYGAKDDASHNYNYSFSAMLYMVSTSEPTSMQTSNNAYFNIGSGAQVIAK